MPCPGIDDCVDVRLSMGKMDWRAKKYVDVGLIEFCERDSRDSYL